MGHPQDEDVGPPQKPAVREADVSKAKPGVHRALQTLMAVTDPVEMSVAMTLVPPPVAYNAAVPVMTMSVPHLLNNA
jgi:hypothetical protein